MRKVLPLTGIGGVRAFNVFHSVILGMSLIPVNIEKGYRSFLDELDQKDDTEKRKFFIDGLRFVPLEESDIEAVIRFVTDENGVPLSKSNTRLMSSSEIIEAMTDVFLEISKINVSIVTEGEKKLDNYSVDIRATAAKHSEKGLEDILNLAFADAVFGERRVQPWG